MLLVGGNTNNKHWQLSNILSVLSLYCTIQCANSTNCFQLSSRLKGRACDSGVSVTFTIHSYQMCQLVSADNFFSFAEQESIFQNRPAIVFKAEVGRSKADCTTVSTLWPHGRPGHWSHDSCLQKPNQRFRSLRMVNICPHCCKHVAVWCFSVKFDFAHRVPTKNDTYTAPIKLSWTIAKKTDTQSRGRFKA